MEISAIRTHLKDILTRSLQEGLSLISEALLTTHSTYNEFLLYKSQWLDVEKRFHQQLLPEEKRNLELAQLRHRIFFWIDTLELEVLAPSYLASFRLTADLEKIESYLKKKGWTRMRFIKLQQQIDERYDEAFLLTLIRHFPERIRRTKVKQEDFPTALTLITQTELPKQIPLELDATARVLLYYYYFRDWTWMSIAAIQQHVDPIFTEAYLTELKQAHPQYFAFKSRNNKPGLLVSL